MRGSLPVGAYTLDAVAESNGQKFTTGYQRIEYDHIRPQTLYRDATVTLEAVDVAIPPGANIAYIQGVGDNSAPALQQLGVPVTIIDPGESRERRSLAVHRGGHRHARLRRASRSWSRTMRSCSTG